PGIAHRTTHYLPRPEYLESEPLGGDHRFRPVLDHYSGGHAVLLCHGRALVALWLAAGHSDRRRRHASGDRAAELLWWAGGCRDGVCVDEQNPDHRRLA